MTTGLTVSITDELVAELEEEARGAFGHPDCGWFDAATFADYFVDAHYLSLVSPATIMSLLAERAELKRDRERYQKLRTVTPYRFKKIQDSAITDGGDVFYFHSDKFDAGLDASSDGIASEDKQ